MQSRIEKLVLHVVQVLQLNNSIYNSIYEEYITSITCTVQGEKSTAQSN